MKRLITTLGVILMAALLGWLMWRALWDFGSIFQ